MIMLRMLAFQPGTRNSEQKPIAANPRTTTQPTQPTPGAQTAQTQAPQSQAQQTKSQHLEAISKTLGSTSPKKKLSSKGSNNITPGSKHKAVETETIPATDSRKDQTTPLPIDENDWESLIENLSLTGVPLQLAKNCALLNCQDKLIELALSESHRQFHSKQREEILQQAIETSTGKKLKLTINFKDKVDGTPALREQQRIRDRQAAAENDIYTDNNVKTIVETFDGRISTKSIRPVD